MFCISYFFFDIGSLWRRPLWAGWRATSTSPPTTSSRPACSSHNTRPGTPCQLRSTLLFTSIVVCHWHVRWWHSWFDNFCNCLLPLLQNLTFKSFWYLILILWMLLPKMSHYTCIVTYLSYLFFKPIQSKLLLESLSFVKSNFKGCSQS